jgi:hypothetical protein
LAQAREFWRFVLVQQTVGFVTGAMAMGLAAARFIDRRGNAGGS